MDTNQMSGHQHSHTSQPQYLYVQPLAQPRSSALAQPSQPHRRTWRIVHTIACVIILVVGVTGNFALLMKPNHTVGSTTPRPSSTAILTPGQQADLYEAAILPRAKILEMEFHALSADCEDNNRAVCETDLQQVRTDATAYHRYLIQLPVPACLQSANTEIIAGLAYFHNGATLGILSMSDNTASELRQAVQGILLGYVAIELAGLDINHAQC